MKPDGNVFWYAYHNEKIEFQSTLNRDFFVVTENDPDVLIFIPNANQGNSWVALQGQSGVWLDRGELDKLIERANEPITRQKSDYDHSNSDDNPTPRMSDFRRPNEHYASRGKKKSILGDLFDFWTA